MAYYRLFRINAAGHFFECESIEAPDDDAAIRQARSMSDESAAELWGGARMVASLHSPRQKQLEEEASDAEWAALDQG